jgi:3-oxoacyl-[acyl-carrier-protein] synthase III
MVNLGNIRLKPDSLQRGRSEEQASISSIAYCLGSLRPISEIDFLRDNERELAFYKAAGFQSYAESDMSMRELASRSAAMTIENCGIDRSEIDVCLYAAESSGRDEQVSSVEVNRLLVELGLEHAMPICISVSNCANIMAALRVALALVQAGEARHVLVVSVDKAPRRYGGRKMTHEMSLKSDGSVSCLISRTGTGAGHYGVLYLAQRNVASLICGNLDDPTSYAMPKYRGIRAAARRAREALEMGAAEFARVVTHNYRRDVTEALVGMCGFQRAAGWFDNIDRFAHAVAGDVLINVKDIDASGALGPGDQVFAMADSVTTTSVLCLRKH